MTEAELKALSIAERNEWLDEWTREQAAEAQAQRETEAHISSLWNER